MKEHSVFRVSASSHVTDMWLAVGAMLNEREGHASRYREGYALCVTGLLR